MIVTIIILGKKYKVVKMKKQAPKKEKNEIIILDIENVEEYWSFMQSYIYRDYDPLEIAYGRGTIEWLLDFFRKIDDCIIMYKKIGEDFHFVNCSKASISKDQTYDCYFSVTNEENFLKDGTAEMEAFNKQFNIRDLCNYDHVLGIKFKTKQNSDFVFVLKRIN